jgi:hypothetical protein
MSDEKESSLRIICFVMLFALIFVFCSWLYYHGFYEGYNQSVQEYKTGVIEKIK